MPLNLLRSLLCMAAFAVLSHDLYAADGVTLIDQKAALSGKVTPGDAPGFPVTISQSGSYRLSSNLVVPDAATTAIAVTADDVTIDLNGFSIVGPNSCTPNPTQCVFSGSGIGVMAVNQNAASPANVRVMNGIVRGMGGHGIRMLGNGTVVEKVQAVSNGGPGIVVGQGSVIDSLVELSPQGTAIVGLIVRGSIAMNNAFGIFIRPGGVASGNVAISNGGGGISVTNATAIGNTANNNGSYGFDAICPGVLIDNTATGNAGLNFRTNGACTISNNSQ